MVYIQSTMWVLRKICEWNTIQYGSTRSRNTKSQNDSRKGSRTNYGGTPTQWKLKYYKEHSTNLQHLVE